MLGDYSIEALEKELEERKKLKKLAPPDIKENIDTEAIKNICLRYTNFVLSKDYCDDNDWEGWIFETVLEACYGEDYWDWHAATTKIGEL